MLDLVKDAFLNELSIVFGVVQLSGKRSEGDVVSDLTGHELMGGRKMKLENEALCVEIAEHGAELTRIYNKRTKEDLLWEGDGRFWKRHAPVLFPNVGKTYRNIMRINGKEYPTSQHGFARDSEFQCTCAERTRARFVLSSSEETLRRYPFEFELGIGYELTGEGIRVSWEVRNPLKETIYFTIGGHPAFRFAGAKEVKEDYMLRFPGKKILHYHLIDPKEEAVDSVSRYDLLLEKECCVVTEQMFERDALIFDGGQIDEVWLCKKDGTSYVGIRCEGFPNFGIWSVKDAPFVCLEPWMGRCDDIGVAGELSQKPNVNVAAPGENFRKEYTILVG